MAATMEAGFASSSLTCSKELSGIKVSLFAFDFDGTCTQEDTTSLHYKATNQYRTSSQAEADELDMRWNELGKLYWSGHQEVISNSLEIYAHSNSSTFNEKGLQLFLQQVYNFDLEMTKKVEASGLLRGISNEGVKEVAKQVTLSPGCLNVLNHVNLPLYLISVNWCKDLIHAKIGHLKHLRIFANNFPLEGELSTGYIDRSISSAFHKEKIFQDLVQKSNISQGISIFIGDSVGDVLALLQADIGVVIGKNHGIRKVAKSFGIKLLPLQDIQKITANGCQEQLRLEQEGVLFEASSWNEIGFLLFGSRYTPNKF